MSSSVRVSQITSVLVKQNIRVQFDSDTSGTAHEGMALVERKEVGMQESAMIVFGINIMLMYLFKLTRFAQQIATEHFCHFVCLAYI